MVFPGDGGEERVGTWQGFGHLRIPTQQPPSALLPSPYRVPPFTCFPCPSDEFHLGSLQSLLGAMPQLQPGVRVHIVLSLLMDRLAK